MDAHVNLKLVRGDCYAARDRAVDLALLQNLLDLVRGAPRAAKIIVDDRELLAEIVFARGMLGGI